MKPEKVVKSLFVNYSLFVLIVFSVFKIDSNFPAIKGLHELFIPDVIGIGRALKTKGWIENVYDFAPDGNLAKEVIKIFWHKVSEKEVIQPTQLAPVSEITAEVFGKILNYIRVFRENGENSSLKAEIVKLWIDACNKCILNINDNSIRKIKKDILVLESLNNNFNLEVSKIEKLNLSKREKELKRQEVSKNINKNKRLIKDKQKTLEKLNGPIEELEITKKLHKNFEREISEVINKIEKLSKSEDFIPEIVESILWAFFEDKFTECEKLEAINNLNICLKQLWKKIEKYEEYDDKDYLVFEEEIKSIDNSEDKIVKIIGEYDRSTNSFIVASGKNFFPKEVKFPQMSYKDLRCKSEPFSTCFESVILDFLSFLLYDPAGKCYKLDILPENARKSNLFFDIIDKVFKDKYKVGFINSEDINAKYQEWINIISNRSGIDYCFAGKINGKEAKYGLNTPIENLIKIFNVIFSLGLEIKYNLDNSEILEITNFENIVQVLELEKNYKPKDAQDFWDIIFNFISKKISTKNLESGRKIKFNCKLYNEPEISILEDKILVSSSYGKISVEIIYNNYKYKNFNIDFCIDLLSTHAAFECKARQQYGLINYESDFKDAVVEKMSKQDYDKKLLPIFILLADAEISGITDFKLQNIFSYCIKLKKDHEKIDFIKLVISNNIIENESIVDLVCKLIEKLPSDENFMAYILFKIIEYTINEKFANKIIQKIFEKNIKYENQGPKIIEKISSSGNNSLYVVTIKNNLFKGR